MTVLSGIIVLIGIIAGFTFGWLASERYTAFMTFVKHDYEELFEKNPHPELFNEDGQIHRGDYMHVTFEPGYDPDEFDPEDIHEEP